MMRKYIIAACSVSLLNACASGQGGPRGDRPVPFAANPSVVLALDIAQSREAQATDAYEALRDTAADNAVTFVPQPVVAKDWLKAQPPLTNTAWQPHQVFLSCDGKTGVTNGAIKWGETDGYYTTVWQYHENSRGKGKWLWVLSHGDALDAPKAPPEFLGTQIASCKGEPMASISAPAEGVQMKKGFSRDQSLSWTWQYRPDKSRTLVVNLWDGEKSVPVLTNVVAAPE